MNDKTFWGWFTNPKDTFEIDIGDGIKRPACFCEGECLHHIVPEVNLKNMFNYCIPELQKRGYYTVIYCYDESGFRVLILNALDGDSLVSNSDGNDLAQVLRQAIEQVISEAGENELVLEYGCRYLNSEFECEKGLLISGKCPSECIYYDDGSR